MRYTKRDCQAACVRLAAATGFAYWAKGDREREICEKLGVRSVGLMDADRNVSAIGLDSDGYAPYPYSIVEIRPGGTGEYQPFGSTRYGAREFCDAVRIAAGAVHESRKPWFAVKVQWKEQGAIGAYSERTVVIRETDADRAESSVRFNVPPHDADHVHVLSVKPRRRAPVTV